MDTFISIPFLVFMPLILSLFVISPLMTSNEIMVRRFVKGVFSFHFAYVIFMLIFFNQEFPYLSNISFGGMDWIQSLGIKFSFKIDNISMILVTLTSFIFLIASISSKFVVRKNHKFYYSMLLLLESAILGIFTSNDMFLFFLFWELEMVPAYFLIGSNFGQQSEEVSKAKSSAVKFILFTFFGSMFLLLGILLLHYYNFVANGNLTAGFDEVFTNTIPISIQMLISISLLIGFGVKLPIVPLHTWLPDAHTNAVTPVSMVLAGVLLKTGAYGIYRFNYLLLSDAFAKISLIIAVLALINIIYIAVLTYAQTDIKRIIAYSSISNMGLILLGLAACQKMALSASVFHMVAHGLVTCGLFMIAGIVYIRYKTRDINVLSGVAVPMPRLFCFAVLIVLASIGVPMFAPFISEILTIIGTMNSDLSVVMKISALLALPILILSSCYMLKFLHKSFYGEQMSNCEKVNDIAVHEFIVLASVLAGLILFGLFPSTLLGFIGG